ncbi:LOG family protein [Schlesneria paludicola]|uniref:LOG family protein n=1 Tax=Schlesneria paludicola TaxID=360056 RepID=UPI00029B3355|nr:TIGR00730 family Rossman fold protein [Schlesneria paludicola]
MSSEADLPINSASNTIPGPIPSKFELDARAALIAEIKETADKLGVDQASRGDLKILSRALKELRYAFKVFTPFRNVKKVTVFGSARTAPDHPDFLASVECGRKMAELGWMVVTGAGGGIMEGAHQGAGAAMSMGVNIMLPFEQEANPVINNDAKLVTFRYFFTRKLMFVKEVHAVVLFPGGFGTQDELFEVLTLVQTGKRDLMPIVCVESPGGTYWANWFEFIRKELLARKLISPHDLSLVRLTDSIDVAVQEVTNFYRNYDSMRYIRDRLILRLHNPVSDELLAKLNAEFKDILTSGTIERTEIHLFEMEDDSTRDLWRLALHFNRRDSARLREMIDLLNQEG